MHLPSKGETIIPRTFYPSEHELFRDSVRKFLENPSNSLYLASLAKCYDREHRSRLRPVANTGLLVVDFCLVT